MKGKGRVGEPGAKKKETLSSLSVIRVAVWIACYFRLPENINSSTISYALSFEFFSVYFNSMRDFNPYRDKKKQKEEEEAGSVRSELAIIQCILLCHTCTAGGKKGSLTQWTIHLILLRLRETVGVLESVRN